MLLGLTAERGEQGVEHRLQACKRGRVRVGCLSDRLQVLTDCRQAALNLEQPFGLSERIAVGEAGADQFARDTGWRA